jgi:hypothetical protein
MDEPRTACPAVFSARAVWKKSSRGRRGADAIFFSFLRKVKPAYLLDDDGAAPRALRVLVRQTRSVYISPRRVVMNCLVP